jgi:hypothetical protein
LGVLAARAGVAGAATENLGPDVNQDALVALHFVIPWFKSDSADGEDINLNRYG